MTDEIAKTLTRRAALVTGIAGAAVAAASAAGAGGASGSVSGPDPRGDGKSLGGPRTRTPVIYLPHGGGPWPFVEMGLPKDEVASLAGYLGGLRATWTTPPRAVLVVSAHWEEPIPTLMTSPRPPILYDYYGFPEASYAITWPAPGDPTLAGRVGELLRAGGFRTAENDARGFDHGTFIPLKLTFPDADVPTVQLSMLSSLDPAEHVRLGRALAPLRDEGVLILGSGMSFHNMRGFRDPAYRSVSETFDAWLGETVKAEAAERVRRLEAWAEAPAARRAHPREEHLLPLMVCAGAAGEDRGTVAWNGTFMGNRLSSVHFAT